MAIEYLDIDAPPSVLAGSYEGTFSGVEPKDTEFGPRWRWTFTVIGPDGPIDVSMFTSQKMNSQTNAYALVQSMTGKPPVKGERVDVKSLIGHKFTVLLSVAENGWNKIMGVAPLPVTALKLSAPFPDDEQPF